VSNTPQAAATFYRMKLGAFTVIALSDGSFDLPSKTLLIEPRAGEVKTLLDRAHLPEQVPSAVNAFLVDTGRKRILVDTGSGNLLGPSLGKLQSSLLAAGYRPEQIDEILLTHLHPDHFGGLSADGHALFPHAIVRIEAHEAAFWQDKSNLAKVDASVQGSFDGAIAALAPYAAAGHIETFHTGATLEPGVTAVAMAGHTVGHTAFRFESAGQTLLMWGDVVHLAAVQFADPKVAIHFDSTPAQAEATREKVFADASARGYCVAASHIAFPGIGHVTRSGSGYAWQPVGAAQR
jgi:glyoxylase-like metal-dependent hydrolase (beta-lactamase superfamily II)